MARKTAPCHNCEKRTLGCHSQREAYNAFDVKNKTNSENRQKDYVNRQAIIDFEFEMKHKFNKRYRRKK